MSTYSLRIFGPAELTASDGTAVLSVLKQPKRTALLAYLATASSPTRTREEVLALFWPGRAPDESRHALSQALYYIRRSLGPSALIVEGEILGLNPDVVATDIARFRAALDADRLEAAVAYCRGELLQGFPAMAGLDPWLDGEREVLRRQVLRALEQLSRRAQAAGDQEGAIQWAERAHLMAPFHEAPLRRLLTALMAASEPVRARETYQRFAAHLRDELDIEPSPVTEAILDTPPAERTRAAQAAVPGQTAATRERPDTAAPVADVSTLLAGPADPAVPAPTPPRSERPSRWVSRGLATAAVLALLLIGAFDRTVFSDPRPHMAAAPAAGRVGIFPFLYRGHPELAYLREGIPELLSISIHSLDQVSMLDPRALAGAETRGAAEPSVAEAAARARDLGAAHFVVGSVVEAGGQIHVTARLHRADGELVTLVSERAASEEDLFTLVDHVVRQLVGSEMFPGGSDLERSAALTGGSLPAVRHFLRGERLFREGRYPDAVSAFDKAVREDSTFALALYRSAIASLWSGSADFDLARSKVAAALAHRQRVSALEADLFRALDEFLNGRLLAAERLYESVLLRQPENIEAWFQLAETRFHYGGLYGRGVEASGEAWRRVLDLNPDHHAALIHLSALAARSADPELASLDERVNPPGGPTSPTPQVRALRVFSSGPEAERGRFLEELRRHPGSAVASTAAYAGRYLRDPAAGARIAQILTEPSRPAAEQAQGHLLLAHFELAQGRPAAANRELALAQRLDSLGAEPHRLLLATIPAIPVRLRGGGGFDAGLRIPQGGPGAPASFDGSLQSGLRVYGRALAYQRAGGEDGALIVAARRLGADAAGSPWDGLLHALAGGLLAERALAQRDTATARHQLSLAVTSVERWYEHLRKDHLLSLARERFLLAETELANGRAAVAESVLGAVGDNAVSELPYLGASLVRIGEIRERTGDRAGAADAYRRALDLWAGAEPVLAPLRDELAARVEALTKAAS